MECCRLWDTCWRVKQCPVDDSTYWHKNQKENDDYKDRLALKYGFSIIRCVVENTAAVSKAIEFYKHSIQKALILKGVL